MNQHKGETANLLELVILHYLNISFFFFLVK